MEGEWCRKTAVLNFWKLQKNVGSCQIVRWLMLQFSGVTIEESL